MIYLNNAATSWPKPKSVIEAVKKYLDSPPFHSERSGLEKDVYNPARSCREGLAKLFNAKNPERFVFTSGSTEALNLAIKGLDLNGETVVTTQTEHNSVIRPLKHLEMEGKARPVFVECDDKGFVDPQKIADAMTPDTKAVIVNHCSNVTGAIQDLKTIAQIARENGAIIIADASQSAGAVPIDIDDWQIDVLAFTGHKSLFGLQGIGGAYIGENVKLKPLKRGGTGILSEVLTQPEGMPIFYESGTPNMPGIISLDAGVKFVLEEGLEKIHARKSSIVKRFIEEFQDDPRVKIYTSLENNSLSNFCFNIEGMVPEEVNYFLDESYGITARSGLHCAPLILESLGVHPWGTVRASPSYFTTDEEAETFVKAVREAAETFSKKK